MDITKEWKTALVSLLLLIAISVGIFFETWASIVDIWIRSTTYTHGFVIAPLSLWLIWSRRYYYLKLSPTISYLGLASLFFNGFIWLNADLSHILVIKQLAVVAMMVSGCWAIVGNAVALSMSFPLLFLFFMVPMGEELVPFLIEFTTTFTVKLLRLTGLPVYREGHSFTLTSGNWSVVDACSGISYLIASITLGFVFAYLNYANYWKRALFMLLSGIVPIIANGFRAYMIVMIGHLSDMTLAVGVDHLIYGGVFFGFVMLLLFYLGSFWRDPPFTPLVIANPSSGKKKTYPITLALAMIVLFSGIWPVISVKLMDKQAANGVGQVLVSPMAGWRVIEKPEGLWIPHFDKAVSHNLVFYDNGSHIIGLYQAGFGKESQGAELVNSENSLIDPTDFREARLVKSRGVDVLINNSLPVSATSNVIKRGDTYILAMDWYQIGDEIGTNRLWVKWRQLLKRLSGDTSPELKSVLWMESPDSNYQAVEPVLKKFLADWLRQNKLSSGW